MPNGPDVRWRRLRPLSPPLDGSSRWKETWTRHAGESGVEEFDVDVRVGKPIDILRLKSQSLRETRAYASFLRETARGLYEEQTSVVRECPCCNAATENCKKVLTVYGVDYVRCVHCGHTFIHRQPSAERLGAVFRDSEQHSGTYTDRATADIRIEQIVRPKLDYVLDTFRALRGRPPGSVLDVGAGAGHFVAECRARGIAAEGIEISVSSRRFAKEVFNIELMDGDFLQFGSAADARDLITLWGVLEYVPEPVAFLKAAHRLLRADGMLVVEVPRGDSFSTAVQSVFSETVGRHLDPTSHMNAFSDESLVSALWRSDFRPVSVWYFGMDIYELLMQLSLNGAESHEKLISSFAGVIPRLQVGLDATANCDDVIIVAEPLR